MNETLMKLLVRIGAGENTFSPKSEGIEDLHDFQQIADFLIEAESQGLIHGVKVHRESQTGERLADLVQLAGLTEYGEASIGAKQ